MLLKLLWIVVVAWIVHRVFIAGRNLVRIALGYEDIPLSAGPADTLRSRDRPPTHSGTPTRSESGGPAVPPANVEDARWVDL